MQLGTMPRRAAGSSAVVRDEVPTERGRQGEDPVRAARVAPLAQRAGAEPERARRPAARVPSSPAASTRSLRSQRSSPAAWTEGCTTSGASAPAARRHAEGLDVGELVDDVVGDGARAARRASRRGAAARARAASWYDAIFVSRCLEYQRSKPNRDDSVTSSSPSIAPSSPTSLALAARGHEAVDARAAATRARRGAGPATPGAPPADGRGHRADVGDAQPGPLEARRRGDGPVAVVSPLRRGHPGADAELAGGEARTSAPRDAARPTHLGAAQLEPPPRHRGEGGARAPGASRPWRPGSGAAAASRRRRADPRRSHWRAVKGRPGCTTRIEGTKRTSPTASRTRQARSRSSWAAWGNWRSKPPTARSAAAR